MSRIYSAQKLQLKQNDKNNRKKVYTHTHIDREMRNKEKKVYAEEKGRKRETGGDTQIAYRLAYKWKSVVLF